jgi:uncharacterized cupin superfamily protein
MPTIIQPEKLEFKVDPSVLEAFKLKSISPRLGDVCNAKHMMFDIRQLDPGKYSFPYHYHHNAEELMMIISGSLTMRTDQGFKIVNKGELVFCEVGETSAHQFFNHTDEPCVYLDIRTTPGIDVTEYPDSGKINILQLKSVFEKSTKVDYNKGEENVQEIWEKLRKK